MASFLEKLKGEKSEKQKERKLAKELEVREKPEGVLQLDVDICQTPTEIIIYASMPGVRLENLDIIMENENDVITIQGVKERPVEGKQEGEEKWLIQECEWGSFFRQIILPQEIDASRIEAKLKRGVLILKLPLISPRGEKRKIEVIEEK